MHRDLKSLLTSARGESRFVVVVFLDVRGFSSFAKLAESSESAVFLKSAYLRILNDFFPEASFFKPTGDGLLLILDYDESSLVDVVRRAVAQSVAVVETFPNICAGDPMVNFPVPDKLGVGLARGAATRLAAEQKTLDYSGRPLNLAARLMDLARPSGVVFDSSLGAELLPASSLNSFSKEDVYVRGIAEASPIEVYALAGRTMIPEINRRPLGLIKRQIDRENLTFRELSQRGRFRHPLKSRPLRTDNIELTIDYPAVTKAGARRPNVLSTEVITVQYVEMQGQPWAQADYGPIVKKLEESGCKLGWTVATLLGYDVPDVSLEK